MLDNAAYNVRFARFRTFENKSAASFILDRCSVYASATEESTVSSKVPSAQPCASSFWNRDRLHRSRRKADEAVRQPAPAMLENFSKARTPERGYDTRRVNNTS